MPLVKVKVDKSYENKIPNMSSTKEFSNFGLFVIFVLIPAFPVLGLWVSSIDDGDVAINFFIFTMSVIILLAWLIVVLTQFHYRKPKNKPTKF